MAKPFSQPSRGHSSRYSAYTGGPDPLAPPVDLREALEQIGQDVMAGTSPRRALSELLRRGTEGMRGADRLAAEANKRRRDLLRRNNLDGTLQEIKKLLDEAVLAERKELARALDDGAPAAAHPQPQPCPSADQRKVRISVTALDRLRSDPYQFYASAILRLKELEPLDAEMSPAMRGELAHAILETWHKTGRPLADIAAEQLQHMGAHPLMRALWRPRLLAALQWAEGQIAADPDRVPTVIEGWGAMTVRGVEIFGKADRIDRLADGTLAIVDYKTGQPPTGREVEAGYALQLGTLGLMARNGGFEGVEGEPGRFEYWSLASSKASETGFGYISTPILEGRKQKGIPLEDFLPETERFLHDALDRWILGNQPFTARQNPDAPGYSTYDQLMRLDEWMGRDQ